MEQQEPTPNPARIEDRDQFEFHVTIEGYTPGPLVDNKPEAVALANKIRGALAREFPDRWSSVTVADYPGPKLTQA